MSSNPALAARHEFHTTFERYRSGRGQAHEVVRLLGQAQSAGALVPVPTFGDVEAAHHHGRISTQQFEELRSAASGRD